MPVSKSRARPRRTQRKGFWPDVCAPGAQSRRHTARATAFSFAGLAGGAALGSVEDAAPSPLQRAAGVIKSRLSTRSARGTNPRGAALRGAGLVRSVGGSFLCLAWVPRAPRPDASASVRRLPSAFLVRGAAVGTAASHSLRFEFVSSRPNAVRFRPVRLRPRERNSAIFVSFVACPEAGQSAPRPPVSAVRHGHTRGRPPDFPESAPCPASSCGGCLSSSELRSRNTFPWQVIKTPMARAVSLPTGRKKPGLRRRKYRPARVTAPHGVVSYGLETQRTAGPRTGV